MSSGPSASPYTVYVNVMGVVNPSVTRSLAQVSSQLRLLQTQVTATSRSLRMGFSRILGLGAGLVGITSIVSGMKEAVELSQQNEQIQEATLVLLKNQRELRHQNAQLAVQDLQTLTSQAERLQQQTGLYKNIFEQGSMILAKTHRSVQEIQSMQNSIANLVVAQRMAGRSAESMGEIYEAIGKSIETGMARNLNAIGVILTRREKQQLMINALTKNYADSIRIVMGVIDRTYAGMAKLRMETLTGRTELAMNNMRLSIERMGNALKPVGQRLQIIFSQIVTLIEPIVVDVAKMVGDFLRTHMKQIRDYIDMLRQKGIPVVIQWIHAGWGWFKENKDWLLPLLKNIGIAFAGWLLVIQPMVGIFTAMINPMNIVLTLVTAIGAALGLSALKFKQFKGFSQMAQDWLFGTERYKYDPSQEKFKAGGAHQIRRALPILGGSSTKGFLSDMITQVAKWVNSTLLPAVKQWLILMEPIFHQWVNNTLQWIWDTLLEWLPKVSKKIDDAIWGWIPWRNTVGKGVHDFVFGDTSRTERHNRIWNPSYAQQPGYTWDDSTTGHLFKNAPHAASDLTKSMTDLKKQTDKLTGNDFTHLNIQTEKLTDAFQELITTMGNTGAAAGGYGGAGGGGGGGGGGDGALAGANVGLNRAGPFPGAVRTMSEWVPGEPRTHATQYGPWGNKLQLNDIAMSVDLMAKMHVKLGDYVDILDKSNKVILAHQHVMDTSWLRPGVPTHGIELWGRKDIGWTKVRKEGTTEAGESTKKPDVTINYNVTHHHQGGEDLEHRMAAIHRRHIDQLKRDIAQAHYETNRSRFDGARSV